MRAITQEQLDLRRQRVLGFLMGGSPKVVDQTVEEYEGETLSEQIRSKTVDDMRRLKNDYAKIQNPSPMQAKAHSEKVSAMESDTVDQMRLADRHDRNIKWIGRMRRAGAISCLSMILGLYGGMVSLPMIKKEPLKNPVTMTLGTVCALSVVALWGSALEMERLERKNRRIQKSLRLWPTLKPVEKEKVKNRELSPIHMGLSGFLETFERT